MIFVKSPFIYFIQKQSFMTGNKNSQVVSNYRIISWSISSHSNYLLPNTHLFQKKKLLHSIRYKTYIDQTKTLYFF